MVCAVGPRLSYICQLVCWSSIYCTEFYQDFLGSWLINEGENLYSEMSIWTGFAEVSPPPIIQITDDFLHLFLSILHNIGS
jgi:hypothetical protein